MASRRIFGLNLFPFFLVLFVLIEFNSSEELKSNERPTVLLKNPTSTGLYQARSKPGRLQSWILANDSPEHDFPENDTPEDVPPEGVSSQYNLRIRRSPGKKPNRVGTLPTGHTRHAPPKTQDITAFPNLTQSTPKGSRKRWVDRNTGEIFEWDSEKGELEKYNKRGKHLGSFDPYTGAQRGEAKSTRSIEP